jgi:hypothetical protein
MLESKYFRKEKDQCHAVSREGILQIGLRGPRGNGILAQMKASS